MSAKPGEIKSELVVNLPRPRVPSIKLSEAFFNLKKFIAYQVRNEAIKSAHIARETVNPGALRIGLHTWPGTAPFFLAQELGFFAEEGLNVELINIEKDADRNMAIKSGEVDLFTTLVDEAIWLRKDIDDLKVPIILNASHGGDGLIANKKIKDIRGLIGKKIAVEAGWVNHYFLLYLLQQNGMTEEMVDIVERRGSDAGAAIFDGNIDAAVTFEPWLSQARELSGGRMLATTRENQVLYDVLACRGSVLGNKAEEISKLKIALDRATEYLRRNRESVKMISAYFGISGKELESLIGSIEFFDGRYKPKTKSVAAAFKLANQVLLASGKISKAVSKRELFD
jgi:NitT/TauT family transport system substrate-binding protein